MGKSTQVVQWRANQGSPNYLTNIKETVVYNGKLLGSILYELHCITHWKSNIR